MQHSRSTSGSADAADLGSRVTHSEVLFKVKEIAVQDCLMTREEVVLGLGGPEEPPVLNENMPGHEQSYI